MAGIELIAAERKRQVDLEDFDAAHDACHSNDQLAMAAVCYALPADEREFSGNSPTAWPWEDKWWKPTPNDRVRELVKAGALIAAEIDRLHRFPAPHRKQPDPACTNCGDQGGEDGTACQVCQ